MRTITAYLAATMSELCKYLFGGNRFAPIRLGDGKKQFSLLLRRQIEADFVIPRKDRDRGSLLERDTFNNDLSADNFSNCHLHDAKDTPVREVLRPDARLSSEGQKSRDVLGRICSISWSKSHK